MRIGWIKTMGVRMGIAIGVLVLWMISAWITHVVVCLKAGTWGFLVAGAIFFPIAVVHGTGVWLGVW